MFFLIDLSLTPRTSLSLTVAFISLYLSRDGFEDFSLLIFLLLFDLFFGKFLGEYSFPILFSTMLVNVVKRRITIPHIILLFIIYAFLFLSLLATSKNFYASVRLSFLTFLVSIILMFLQRRYTYEKAKI